MGARTPPRTPLERGISRAGKAGERGDLAEPIVERAQRCQRVRGPLEEPRTSEVRHLVPSRKAQAALAQERRELILLDLRRFERLEVRVRLREDLLPGGIRFPDLVE